MIKYRLICTEEHVFETWFANMADYDTKAADGALSCPQCGDTHIAKSIMAPNVTSAYTQAPAPACAAAPSCGNAVCPMAAAS